LARSVQLVAAPTTKRRTIMTATTQVTPVIIVAAVDDTAVADDVLRTAGRLATALVNAELHVVRVVLPPAAPLDGTLYATAYAPNLQQLVAEAREQLAEVASASTEYFKGPCVTHVLMGAPGREIVELATKLDADVVVVGPHSMTSLSRLLLGSVSEHVVRHATCSVLVARVKEPTAAAAIEPPCPACLAAREKTGDQTAWCEQHSRHHVRANLHYEVPASFGVGSTFLRPPD
jgi:nucleotide-binding universal stress UspA family protein